jgi:EAL domain-containing protein (putative c-di-GMP-specific phosphodiesterase class I)
MVRLVARFPAWAAVVVLAALLAAAWYAVYSSGGTQRAMPHLFYIPVILAALPFGLRGTMITAAVATVLCGPLTPLNTATGEEQQVFSWAFRGVMFALMGVLASLAITIRTRYAEQQLTSDVQEAMGAAPRAREIDESLVPLVGQVLADRSFHPVFQPIYSLADGHLTGVEALTRFDVEPYRTPDLWFAAAESTGHGIELELAAIEVALVASQTLPHDVVLSLNASPATLGDPRLSDLVRAHPEREFIVEITEHAVVADYHLLQGVVGKLRALGVRIAVDDAGAGFSTLQHIVQLGPETIKVDISLTQGVSISPLRRALAGSLIEFAQRTGAELVVEGVEEEHDLVTWIALGADAAQGYLIGRPGALPVDGVNELIASMRIDRVEHR